MKKTIKFFLIPVTVLFLFATVVAVLGGAFLARYKDSRVDPTLLNISLTSEETSFYYFEFTDRQSRRGKAVKLEDATLDSGIKYRFKPISDIPEHLINAFIAIEDKRFYKHHGVDYYRTAGAVVNYMFASGNFGGSTITQQLVKNLTGKDEFSVERKLEEAFAALKLEEEYDKSQILEMYLNVINLSEGCRGVGAASDFFFSKEPIDLTLSEAATIAAITNNPSRYDPLKHPENAKRRRDLVLLCMKEQNYITDAEYDAALSEPIKLSVSKNKQKKNVNSWYIDMVVEDVLNGLCEKYSISRRAASLMLNSGGYRIYTAMDPQIQDIVETYYSDELNFPIDETGGMPQSAMIVIDPYTGDILGVAGAVGRKSGNRVQNYATDTQRPPGSTMKPIAIYAPALEKGLIEWSSIFEDSAVRQENGRAWPQNFDRTYLGNVDIAYAVSHSLNTVPVRILALLGEKETMELLRESLYLYSLDAQKDVGAAALALGQPTKGITLRELTASYSIFTEGIMSMPRSYYKVTDQTGRIILDNVPLQKSLLSTENAAIMTKLLEGVVDEGTARGAVSLDRSVDVAGKSGTTTGNCDRYFIGYTPQLLAGVWYGYEYPKDLSAFGGNLSVAYWNEVMKLIYDNTDYGKGNRHFTVPDSIEKRTYHKETGLPPSAFDDPSMLKDGWFVKKHN